MYSALRALTIPTIVGLSFLMPFSAAFAAAITFNTALPVSKGELIFREQITVTRSSDTFSGISRDATTVKSISVLGFGPTRKLAVFGILPIVNIERDIGGIKSDASGLGDATLFVRFETYRNDSPGRTVRIAPFAGLIVPTGREGQTGDGSLDVFGGLIFTAATINWVFDSQVKYIINSEANGFQRGDSASVDASLQYRLFSDRDFAKIDRYIYGVIEANLTYFDNNELAGFVDPNSGGTQIWISPGIQFAAKRWIAETAIRIPVVNNLNGSTLEQDYSFVVSLRFNF